MQKKIQPGNQTPINTSLSTRVNLTVYTRLNDNPGTQTAREPQDKSPSSVCHLTGYMRHFMAQIMTVK